MVTSNCSPTDLQSCALSPANSHDRQTLLTSATSLANGKNPRTMARASSGSKARRRKELRLLGYSAMHAVAAGSVDRGGPVAAFEKPTGTTPSTSGSVVVQDCRTADTDMFVLIDPTAAIDMLHPTVSTSTYTAVQIQCNISGNLSSLQPSCSWARGSCRMPSGG